MPVAPAWAAEYVGIPFVPNGQTHEGLDCWQLARIVAREQFGIDYPDYDIADPCDGPQVGARSREITAAPPWRQVTIAEARPPDVVVFRVLPHPSHVGVFLTPQWFLHIRAGTCSALGRLDAIIWRHRIDGVFRYDP